MTSTTTPSSNPDQEDASPKDMVVMGQRRIALIHALLKGLETGDPAAVDNVIHPHTYVQHNPQTNTDIQGLKDLFARISKTAPHVNFVRSFWDGEHVFLHTEYDFATRRIGFEVFRFDGLYTVEHWDNIMPRKTDANPSGHSMVDGGTEITDLEHTERHRTGTRQFFETLVASSDKAATRSTLEAWCAADLIQHNPDLGDGRQVWLDSLLLGNNGIIQYTKVHRVLAQGNFCLCVSEGYVDHVWTAFYDLVRWQKERIVEHWDTRETVAPVETWKNSNGKF